MKNLCIFLFHNVWQLIINYIQHMFIKILNIFILNVNYIQINNWNLLCEIYHSVKQNICQITHKTNFFKFDLNCRNLWNSSDMKEGLTRRVNSVIGKLLPLIRPLPSETTPSAWGQISDVLDGKMLLFVLSSETTSLIRLTIFFIQITCMVSYNKFWQFGILCFILSQNYF